MDDAWAEGGLPASATRAPLTQPVKSGFTADIQGTHESDTGVKSRLSAAKDEKTREAAP